MQHFQYEANLLLLLGCIYPCCNPDMHVLLLSLLFTCLSSFGSAVSSSKITCSPSLRTLLHSYCSISLSHVTYAADLRKISFLLQDSLSAEALSELVNLQFPIYNVEIAQLKVSLAPDLIFLVSLAIYIFSIPQPLAGFDLLFLNLFSFTFIQSMNGLRFIAMFLYAFSYLSTTQSISHSHSTPPLILKAFLIVYLVVFYSLK